MTTSLDSTTPELIQQPIPLILENVHSPHQQSDDGTMQILSEGKTFEDLKQMVKMEIEKCPINTELDVLLKTLQSDPMIIEHYCKIVTNDLHCILLPLCPKQIDLFGSTVMGVSFQGCDLDFHVSVTRKTRDNSLLHRVHQLLTASNKFSDFEVICNARVPIVKCRHIGSGFQCDINFTSKIGVYNSRILAHLFRFDQRVHRLAILVKFWMKFHNLIASKSITSYAAIWLVIFYLQQLDVPLLPPIEAFQRDVPHFAIGAANLTFNFTLPNPLTKNVDGILTLLHGFFEFYAKFDFETQLISPLHGRAFPRHDFERMFPHQFARYRETLNSIRTAEPMRFGKPICIQDPFEICRSIPGQLNGLYYETFRDALTNAARAFRGNLTTTSGSKELFLALLNGERKEPANYFIQKANGKRTLSVEITPILKEIVLIKKYFNQNSPNVYPSNDDVKQLWVKMCISIFQHMLRKIFGFHFQSGTSDTESDFTKSFDMIAPNYVFGHRKPMKIPVPNIDTEIRRTKKRMKTLLRAGKCNQKPIQIKCNIWADLQNDLATVFIDITDDDKNPLVSAFHVQFHKRARQLIYGYFELRKFYIDLVDSSVSLAFVDEKTSGASESTHTVGNQLTSIE